MLRKGAISARKDEPVIIPLNMRVGCIIGKGKGNPYAALHTKKNLSELERLELENLKLRIENERLKKGYMVKGVGANKEFVTFKDKNTK